MPQYQFQIQPQINHARKIRFDQKVLRYIVQEAKKGVSEKNCIIASGLACKLMQSNLTVACLY
uniref:Uncharacterized protein n=1 Tax=Arundo donax TaxID=35708 RepID=A0A0A9AR01_ARUDO